MRAMGFSDGSLSGFVIFEGLGLLVVFFVVQLFMIGVIRDLTFLPIILLATIATLIIPVVVLAVTVGQGGNRVTLKNVTDNRDTRPEEISRDDDRFWKWGVIYNNPDDPALFVEKRVGVGLDRQFR